MHEYKSRRSQPNTHHLYRADPDKLDAGNQEPSGLPQGSLGQCESGIVVSGQLHSKSVWGTVRLAVLCGSAGAGWVASHTRHHLPSCWHPVQDVLGVVNRWAHHRAHGCGLAGWARQRATVSLQDARAFPVLHIVCCRERAQHPLLFLKADTLSLFSNKF